MKKYKTRQTVANYTLLLGVIIIFLLFLIVRKYDHTPDGSISVLVFSFGFILCILSEAIRPETIWTVDEISKEVALKGKKFDVVESTMFDNGYLTTLKFDKIHTIKLYSEKPFSVLDICL